jgi:hypothetical protein
MACLRFRPFRLRLVMHSFERCLDRSVRAIAVLPEMVPAWLRWARRMLTWDDRRVFVSYDPAWGDRASSWWAKVDRAREHMDSARELIERFRASQPYSVLPEPTGTPGRVAYRLQIVRPVPVAVSTTVGDVLHNLRAALESVAFEVARRNHAGPLTPAQERASTFPICDSPASFDRFFTGARASLYGDRGRAALRAVQPFVNLEQAHLAGVGQERTFEEEFGWSLLHRLDALWNLDKHRRLTLTAWWPDLFYWMSNGPSPRTATPGDGTMADGSILLYIEGPDDGQPFELQHEFHLALTDDPAFRHGTRSTDILDLLEQFYEHIAGLVVFPRIFTIMSALPR